MVTTFMWWRSRKMDTNKETYKDLVEFMDENEKEKFLFILENLQINYAWYKDYEEHPEWFTDEELGFLKTDIQQGEEDLEEMICYYKGVKKEYEKNNN